MSEESAALEGIRRPEHLPRRDDPVATWLREKREAYRRQRDLGYPQVFNALDALLDEYRERADFGASLSATPGEHYGYDE